MQEQMQDQTHGFKLIKAGLLIDGKGGPPVEQGAVLVQGSKIVAVGRERDVVPPEGAAVETRVVTPAASGCCGEGGKH